jgi:transcriptional regulator with XRE-family HTH domain
MPSASESSDKALLREIGARLRSLRLRRNESQAQLAERAGVGKATLQRLEDGNSGTLVTFLRVLRALDLTDELDALLPAARPSPIESLAGRPAGRRRGGRTAASAEPGQAWLWGDESEEGK